MRIGDISLYRYLQVNLGFAPGNVLKWLHPVPVGSAESAKPQRQDRLCPGVDAFLRDLPPALGVPSRCIAFLLDSDRYASYTPELATPRKDGPDLRAYALRQANALALWAATTVMNAAPEAAHRTAPSGNVSPGRQPLTQNEATKAAMDRIASVGPNTPKARRRTRRSRSRPRTGGCWSAVGDGGSAPS